MHPWKVGQTLHKPDPHNKKYIYCGMFSLYGFKKLDSTSGHIVGGVYSTNDVSPHYRGSRGLRCAPGLPASLSGRPTLRALALSGPWPPRGPGPPPTSSRAAPWVGRALALSLTALEPPYEPTFEATCDARFEPMFDPRMLLMLAPAGRTFRGRSPWLTCADSPMFVIEWRAATIFPDGPALSCRATQYTFG